jgi:hypothetical protein
MIQIETIEQLDIPNLRLRIPLSRLDGQSLVDKA